MELEAKTQTECLNLGGFISLVEKLCISFIFIRLRNNVAKILL